MYLMITVVLESFHIKLYFLVGFPWFSFSVFLHAKAATAFSAS